MADDFIPDSGGDDFVPAPSDPSAWERLKKSLKDSDYFKPEAYKRPISIKDLGDAFTSKNPLLMPSMAAGAALIPGMAPAAAGVEGATAMGPMLSRLLGTATSTMAPGAAAGGEAASALLSKIMPEAAGPMTQGIARGMAGGLGMLGGQSLQNMAEGKSANPLPPMNDPGGIAATAAPFVAGPLAGLFASRVASNGPAAAKEFASELAKAAETTPENLQGQNPASLLKPLQTKIQGYNLVQNVKDAERDLRTSVQQGETADVIAANQQKVAGLKAQLKAVTAPSGEGSIKVDPDNIPAQVGGTQEAVATANRAQKQLDLLPKTFKVQDMTGQKPPLPLDVPDAEKRFKNLANAGSKFAPMLMDPDNYKVAAAAAGPDGQQALKLGVINQMLQAASPGGKTDPTKLRAIWTQGPLAETLQLALGPGANQGTPFVQKVNEYADFLQAAQKKQGLIERVVKSGAGQTAFGALIGGAASHGAGGNLLADAAVAGGAAAATHAMNWLTDQLLTNDKLRKGALDWAKGSGVGQVPTDAAKAFWAYMSQDSQGQ